jgi:hypothetical protein
MKNGVTISDFNGLLRFLLLNSENCTSRMRRGFSVIQQARIKEIYRFDDIYCWG